VYVAAIYFLKAVEAEEWQLAGRGLARFRPGRP